MKKEAGKGTALERPVKGREMMGLGFSVIL